MSEIIKNNCTSLTNLNNIEIDIFGYLGALFISLVLIPQVYLTFKLEECDSLSINFIILQLIASVLFIVYGNLINSLPIIIANTIALINCLLLIYAKKKFTRRNPGLNNIININTSLSNNDYIVTANSPDY